VFLLIIAETWERGLITRFKGTVIHQRSIDKAVFFRNDSDVDAVSYRMSLPVRTTVHV